MKKKNEDTFMDKVGDVLIVIFLIIWFLVWSLSPLWIFIVAVSTFVGLLND